MRSHRVWIGVIVGVVAAVASGVHLYYGVQGREFPSVPAVLLGIISLPGDVVGVLLSGQLNGLPDAPKAISVVAPLVTGIVWYALTWSLLTWLSGSSKQHR